MQLIRTDAPETLLMTRIGKMGLMIWSSALTTQLVVVAASQRTAFAVEAADAGAACPFEEAADEVSGIGLNVRALAERDDC